MAAFVCSGHQHFSQVIHVPSFNTSAFVISDWRRAIVTWIAINFCSNKLGINIAACRKGYCLYSLRMMPWCFLRHWLSRMILTMYRMIMIMPRMMFMVIVTRGWWAWWEMRLVQERLLLKWSGWDLAARHMPVTDRPASTPDLPGESTTLNHLKPKIKVSVFHFLCKKNQDQTNKSWHHSPKVIQNELVHPLNWKKQLRKKDKTVKQVLTKSSP